MGMKEEALRVLEVFQVFQDERVWGKSGLEWRIVYFGDLLWWSLACDA